METVIGQPNVLLAWVNDEAARQMEKTGEADVKQGMEKLLEMAFRKQFAPTPIKNILRYVPSVSKKTKQTEVDLLQLICTNHF